MEALTDFWRGGGVGPVQMQAAGRLVTGGREKNREGLFLEVGFRELLRGLERNQAGWCEKESWGEGGGGGGVEAPPCGISRLSVKLY